MYNDSCTEMFTCDSAFVQLYKYVHISKMLLAKLDQLGPTQLEPECGWRRALFAEKSRSVRCCITRALEAFYFRFCIVGFKFKRCIFCACVWAPAHPPIRWEVDETVVVILGPRLLSSRPHGDCSGVWQLQRRGRLRGLTTPRKKDSFLFVTRPRGWWQRRRRVDPTPLDQKRRLEKANRERKAKACA